MDFLGALGERDLSQDQIGSIEEVLDRVNRLD
jgi:hypothetical protein